MSSGSGVRDGLQRTAHSTTCRAIRRPVGRDLREAPREPRRAAAECLRDFSSGYPEGRVTGRVPHPRPGQDPRTRDRRCSKLAILRPMPATGGTRIPGHLRGKVPMIHQGLRSIAAGLGIATLLACGPDQPTADAAQTRALDPAVAENDQHGPPVPTRAALPTDGPPPQELPDSLRDISREADEAPQPPT
jgi:hypothetical protein